MTWPRCACVQAAFAAFSGAALMCTAFADNGDDGFGIRRAL